MYGSVYSIHQRTLVLINVNVMRTRAPTHGQIGACIVNSDKKIVGIGYNGFPNGCDDDKLS